MFHLTAHVRFLMITIRMITTHCVKSVRIRSFSDPNAGKYIPEKLRIRTLFTQWHIKRFDCDRSVLNET